MMQVYFDWKFTNTMPKMEVIRKVFILQTELRGELKIVHFNCRHIYVDLDNEYDHSIVWSKGRMYIEGQIMRFRVWTPTSKPEEEKPLVPVGAILPELPWHCYCPEAMTPLLSPIGKILFLNLATYRKTRGSVAKVKIQIDLTKKRPHHVWMGFDDYEYGDGRWQSIQYEGVPVYSHYCKHQGHSEMVFTIKRMGEEHKRMKEQEATTASNSNIPDTTGKETGTSQQNQDSQPALTVVKDHDKKMSKPMGDEPWQIPKNEVTRPTNKLLLAAPQKEYKPASTFSQVSECQIRMLPRQV